MRIRRAEIKDTEKILDLLSQVLEIHATIRPDIFVSGTTKYGTAEIAELLGNDEAPIYVAVDDGDAVLGYAMCRVREQPAEGRMVQFKSLFIDDLCVDEAARGAGVGTMLFEHVKNEARRLGCYEVTLVVWDGNDSAERFYEKMGMKTKERMLEYIL
ncbi:MAG: GNAT family N-acetyltransferase [Clostridia bacterium]|nr:GNAT family N-acetyltransferase [Clostridia bacterium]